MFIQNKLCKLFLNCKFITKSKLSIICLLYAVNCQIFQYTTSTIKTPQSKCMSELSVSGDVFSTFFRNGFKEFLSASHYYVGWPKKFALQINSSALHIAKCKPLICTLKFILVCTQYIAKPITSWKFQHTVSNLQGFQNYFRTSKWLNMHSSTNKGLLNL